MFSNFWNVSVMDRARLISELLIIASDEEVKAFESGDHDSDYYYTQRAAIIREAARILSYAT